MTAPAPIARMTSDLVREMRGQAPGIADALKQCRDALAEYLEGEYGFGAPVDQADCAAAIAAADSVLASLAAAPQPQPVSPADELPASVQGEVPDEEDDLARDLVAMARDFDIDPHPLFATVLRTYGDARAQAVRREPLSDEAIIDAFCTTPHIHISQFLSAFKFGARFAERAHGIGITAQAQQEGGNG